MLSGGVIYHRQFDIKRLLAYSSIENMGLISFALVWWPNWGYLLVYFTPLTIGLAKTLLFCASGNILLKYKTRDMIQCVVYGVLHQ